MTHPLYNQTGLQKNNKKHVMYALANKQMELKQIQDEYEAKILKIKTDLTALETTICLFDGDCGKTIEKLNVKSSRSTPRKRNKYFVKGECKKITLRLLREANKSISTDNIVKKSIEIQGFSLNDDYLVRNIAKTINMTLRKLENENLVIVDENYPDTSRMLYWKIKDR